MKKNRKNLLIVLAVVGFCFVTVIAIFLFFIFYESKIDVSDKEPYIYYLNRPLEIKHESVIRWERTGNRFLNYSLSHNVDPNYSSEDVKPVKNYQPGDKITFYAAKKYKSMHVGDTYHLIGRDTLDNGKTIEFEYYMYDRYFYNIWETEEEYIERVNNLN